MDKMQISAQVTTIFSLISGNDEIVMSAMEEYALLISSQHLILQKSSWKQVDYFITDKDECAGQSLCHSDATCQNIIGSYTCTCKNGYVGNRVNCTGTFFSNLE